jgi:hypothetical protein
MYIRGPIEMVEIIENTLRSNTEFLQVRKNGGGSLFGEQEPQMRTRLYETSVQIRNEKRAIRLKFVYDERSGYGKIEALKDNDLATLFRCIPDVSCGISELHVGEKLKAKAIVLKTDSGLPVEFTCPFCNATTQHICGK